VELRDIEYFAVVAEHRHLGRAAEALGLSHPALSKSLRRLETAVEAKLVKRTPKGVELTAEGTALLAHVRDLRLSLRDLTREIKDIGKGLGGYVRLGVAPGVDEKLVPSSCAELLKDAPRLMVKATWATNDVLVPALRNGEYDLIASGIASPPAEGLVHEPLYEDQFVVVASAAHRFANRDTVQVAELAQERWVLSQANTLSWRWLHRAFDQHELSPPRVAVESSSTNARLRIVACSGLLGFGARRMVRQAAERGLPLVDIRVEGIDWSRTVGISYRKDAYLPPSAKRLIEILRRTARELPEP
jgi:DNA-binding transcriptional LysR family regulator